MEEFDLFALASLMTALSMKELFLMFIFFLDPTLESVKLLSIVA